MKELRYPQALVDRIIERRGRLRLYERLEPRRTALLVVDLQVHFMQPGSPAEMPSAREVVPAVNRLAGALRARGGRIQLQDDNDRGRERRSHGGGRPSDLLGMHRHLRRRDAGR